MPTAAAIHIAGFDNTRRRYQLCLQRAKRCLGKARPRQASLDRAARDGSPRARARRACQHRPRRVAYLEALLDEITPQHGPDAGLVIDDQDMKRVSHPRAGIEPCPGEKRACSTCHKASHFASFRHQKPRLLASTGDMASVNLVLAGPIQGLPS
jgi:hypothetical protein